MMSGSGQKKNQLQKLVQTTLDTAFFHSASGQSCSQEKGVKRRFDDLEMNSKKAKPDKQPQKDGAAKSQPADALKSKNKTPETALLQHSDTNAGKKDNRTLRSSSPDDKKSEDEASSQRKKPEEEGDEPKERNTFPANQNSKSISSGSPAQDGTEENNSLSKDNHSSRTARTAEPHSEGLKHHLKTAPACLHGEKVWLLSTLPSYRDEHSICFQVPISYGNDGPKPYPPHFIDKWSEEYVRMPCSIDNKYPDYEGGRGNLESRWKLIEKTLNPPGKEPFEYFIRDSFELQKAILTYNKHNEGKWNFANLHKYFHKCVTEEDKKNFFHQLLPKMCRLALKLPELCTKLTEIYAQLTSSVDGFCSLLTKPIQLLKKGTQRKITLSQQQIACLLANAFFCTFPRRNTKSRKAEYSNYPDINFNNLFQKGYRSDRKLEKLRCILHYFERVCCNPPWGIVTFARQVRPPKTDWEFCQETFTELFVSPEGTIEDDGIGMLQVDFANKYIGGGALNTGLVQEEIRFMICPEMIVSRLFTESMSDNECIIMTGCERFSKYTGYADTFKFDGNFEDLTERDKNGRLYCEVVAIDALVFKDNPRAQFRLSNVDRELNKAYCGFFTQELSEQRPAVCTGNWGCGAFGGDKQLKSLIQLMAAAATKRQVCYLTFKDMDLSENLRKVHKLLTEKKKKVGDVYKLINDYNKNVVLRHIPRISLFDYIFEQLEGFSCLKDSDDEMSREELENRSHASSSSLRGSDDETIRKEGENRNHASSSSLRGSDVERSWKEQENRSHASSSNDHDESD